MSVVRAEAEGAIVSSTELVAQMGLSVGILLNADIAESFRDNL